MNTSVSDRFESLFFRAWHALRNPEDPELSPHEREVLAHVPVRGGIALRALVEHLLLPQSTMSVLVKDLEKRGFVRRMRDPADERRLAIVLTARGRAKLRRPGLDRGKLGPALDSLNAGEAGALMDAFERVVEKAEVAGKPARHVLQGRPTGETRPE